ncbi:MAG TPA: hypothetical protein PLQ88_14105 [Blastocatellia bacterium]|nr:hypothetical protein [Blastocatellia bacterium]
MTEKKTEIKIETREIWTIRRAQPARHGWCFSCNARVELVTPEEASLVTGTGLRQIFRQIEQAQIHFLETPAGGVLLCLPSLVAK